MERINRLRRGLPWLLSLLGWFAGASLPGNAAAQTPEIAVVNASSGVLQEIMHAPGSGIPEFLLNDAHGIAIVPGVVKLGFVVGVRLGSDNVCFARRPASRIARSGSMPARTICRARSNAASYPKAASRSNSESASPATGIPLLLFGPGDGARVSVR